MNYTFKWKVKGEKLSRKLYSWTDVLIWMDVFHRQGIAFTLKCKNN